MLDQLKQCQEEQLLTELEHERENIDRMIIWVKGRMEQTDSAESVVSPAKPALNTPMRFPRVLAADTFFRLTVPEAIKKYLNIAKRPKTAKDITAGLEAGGLTHQAKNLYATVYPTLLRMEKANEVARISKGEWGLSEWYSGRKANQEEKTESKD